MALILYRYAVKVSLNAENTAWNSLRTFTL